MKIDRIISILMLLLNGEMISAPELSKIFGVSTRTIHRDIEVINKAGIPLVTAPGVNGGIAVPEDFKIDKKISAASDISSAIIALINEYPGLVDDDSYILAKHRNETSERERKKSAVIKVTIRFRGAYKDDLEKQYGLNIISLNADDFYEADIYIEADEREYDRLLLSGDKCECIEPRHVREYIKNKIGAIHKVYIK